MDGSTYADYGIKVASALNNIDYVHFSAGIIAGVMKLLADNGISVRQVITDDPDLKYLIDVVPHKTSNVI